ncbi:hypothetical protein N0V90_010813 [Kalmusia sp. IMI 367209]|nr:hypothetical protein N0V90_010813 [Kalmusia sp. IMI 367209]
MASKSQSPGPNPTTSQPKQARSRKAATQGEQNAAGRAGSAGGIVLEKEKAVKKATTSIPITTPKGATQVAAPPQAKDQDTANTTTSTGPNRQRRRPRKLNREPIATDDASNTAAAGASTASAPTAELEALKSRVRGLEAKVEELYKSSEGRKNSSAQATPTLSTAAATAAPEDEEADEELDRLEDELETARRDLEVYQPRIRPRGKRSTSGNADEIEEIPRRASGVEEALDTEGRQVTLSGSYRIPLPSKLNMEDVKTIQSGVSAAQNVVRSCLEQRRAAQAARSSNPTTPSARSTMATPKPSRKTSSMEISKETEGKSWGEWFGGYSVAISRAVKNIEAEAAIESQRQASSTAGPSSGKKKGTAGGGAKRPAARGRQGSELTS